jgi:hypothetical protein
MEEVHGNELIKVLTVDGGGIRGLIPALFVAEIERRCGKPVHELFDVIAGTSTGALVTAMLTLPEPHTYSGEELVEYYLSTRPNAFFERSWLYKVRSVNGFWRPKYPAQAHIKALTDALGTEARLKDSLCEIAIPVYDLRGSAPRTFTFTRHDAANDINKDYPIWEVVRAASTASGYFPGWNLRNAAGVKAHAPVDGGIYVNNPVIEGFSHAVDLQGGAEVVAEEDIEFMVVSLGTGFYNEPIHRNHEKHWGFLGWGPHLLDVMFEGQSDAADKQAQAIPNVPGPFKHYLRLQAKIGAPYQLDDIAPEIRQDLRESAERTIEERDADIDKICRQLT